MANYKTGPDHHRWTGGVRTAQGYKFVKAPDHPRADRGGYVQEHIIIAEAALGRILPSKARVHHVNGDKTDNRHENLVICETNGYHRLLHARMDARAATGNANWKRCPFCHQYGDPANMYRRRKDREQHEHAACRNAYNRARYKERQCHSST